MARRGRPLFSILVPVYNPPADALMEMLESVGSQSLSDWELILVDDRSTEEHVANILSQAAASDERVRVMSRSENGGIIAASNDGLTAASGEFVALLDHDDMLDPRALRLMAAEIDRHPDVDYLYSDEDKVDASGVHFDRFDKPDWSPERLRGQMYTGHLSVFRTELVRKVGGFSDDVEGSQDHDLVFKVTERARRISHIREVLYHWRIVPGSTAEDIGNKPYAWDAGVRAVNGHLQRSHIRATAYRGPVPGTYRIDREAELNRTVSVIIPTRGTKSIVWGNERVLVIEAVRSLLEHTAHPSVEVVVVYDVDTPLSVLADLKRVAGERLTLVPFEGVFNFSRKCNVGALTARGEVLLFLNDDVEVISDEAVGQLLAPLREADVGMTGAFLLFEDGLIQHAGHSHHKGRFFHPYFGESADAYGAFSSLLVNRECSGLTAACIAMPRSVFTQVGGFSEAFPGNFNDVDLGNKVRREGYRLVLLHDVRLYHFESRSRNPLVHSFEERQTIERWGVPGRDPFIA